MAAARVRCAIGQRRILWLGWAGLGRAGQEHGWGRYLNTFYKIEI